MYLILHFSQFYVCFKWSPQKRKILVSLYLKIHFLSCIKHDAFPLQRSGYDAEVDGTYGDYTCRGLSQKIQWFESEVN
jgi:hypothetical protein